MIIQEAIKSGKPFKRPEHTPYLIVFQQMFYVEMPELDGINITLPALAYQPVHIAASAILADDWEIKED